MIHVVPLMECVHVFLNSLAHTLLLNVFFALKGTHFYIYLKKRVQTNFKSIK